MVVNRLTLVFVTMFIQIPKRVISHNNDFDNLMSHAFKILLELIRKCRSVSFPEQIGNEGSIFYPKSATKEML